MILEHGWVETQAFVREPIVQLAAEGISIDLVARGDAELDADPWSPVPATGRPCGSHRRRRLLRELLGRGLLRRDYDLVIATPGGLDGVRCGARSPVGRAPGGLARRALDAPRREPRTLGSAAAMYRAHERAALTVITDLRRVEVLEADWPALAGQRFVELPNAPAGPPRPSRDRATIRADLGIADDTVLLLNAGLAHAAVRPRRPARGAPRLPRPTRSSCASRRCTRIASTLPCSRSSRRSTRCASGSTRCRTTRSTTWW